eukprot:364433-Chlamydomonas_euryale.AAC.14
MILTLGCGEGGQTSALVPTTQTADMALSKLHPGVQAPANLSHRAAVRPVSEKRCCIKRSRMAYQGLRCGRLPRIPAHHANACQLRSACCGGGWLLRRSTPDLRRAPSMLGSCSVNALQLLCRPNV